MRLTAAALPWQQGWLVCCAGPVPHQTHCSGCHPPLLQVPCSPAAAAAVAPCCFHAAVTTDVAAAAAARLAVLKAAAAGPAAALAVRQLLPLPQPTCWGCCSGGLWKGLESWQTAGLISAVVVVSAATAAAAKAVRSTQCLHLHLRQAAGMFPARAVCAAKLQGTAQLSLGSTAG